MYKYVLTLVGLIFSIFSGFTQNEPFISSIIPPSPDAASLGKYGDFTVGKYTGTANVSIPIYTINANGFDVPISLSYNTSGVKVEEQASWVGLGWSLNAGGLVTISASGLPDFSPNSGYLTHNYDLSTFPSLPENQKKDLVSLISNASLDIDPDLYSYNVNGNSGKFIIEKSTMKAIAVPQNDLLIKLPDPSTGNDWVIIDSKGNNYIFNKRELSISDDRNGHVHTYTSTFYLSKIITFKKEEIIFNYQPYNCLYYVRTDASKDYVDPQNSNPVPLDCLNSNKERYSLMEIQGFRIESIDWSGGKIQFVKKTVLREDILNDYSLGEIKILDRYNQLLKKFKFSHDYFIGTGNGYPSFLTSQMPNKRLRLTSVTESDPNDVLLNPYIFEYHNNLPYYFTHAQDLWGYYNGAESNTTLFPRLTATLGDANRKVNEASSKAGLLQKIIYPTKGFSTFEYESNDALIPATEYYKYLEPIYTPSPTPQQLSVSLLAGQHNVSLAVPASIISTDNLRKFVYTITYPESINCSGTNRDCTGNMEILLTSTDNSHVVDLVASGNFINGVSTGEVWLQAGKTYTLSKYGSGISNNTICSITGLNNPLIHFVNNVPYVNVKTGGVRIFSIVSNAQMGASTEKKYFYHSGVQISESEKLNQPSSGRLTSYPVFSFFTVTNGANYSCSKYTMYANSVAPMATNGGSSTGYKFCQEVNYSPDLSLKTLTEFVSSDDFPDQFSYEYPFLNEQSRDYMRGFIKNEKIFKGINGGYEPLSEETSSYEYVENSYKSSNGCKNGCNDYYRNVSLGTNECLNTIFKIYTNSSKWFYKNLSEKKEFVNGTLVSTTISHYFYDNSQHKQITRLVTTNSKNEELGTVYKYPSDFAAPPNSAPNVYNEMVNAHRISEVIDNTNFNYTKVIELDHTKTNFNYFNNGNLILPEIIQRSRQGSVLENDIIVSKYCASGNIEQYTDKDGVVVSVIWGYNGVYPVAVIKNLAYGSVISQSGIDLFILNAGNNIAAMKDELNKLYTLQNGFVSTYLYKPIVGIIYETDSRGIAKSYEYDSFGRLILIRDNNNSILKKICYNYSGQTIDCQSPVLHFNTIQSQSFTKNNCGTCSLGSQVTYTVAANTYSSTVSPEAANLLALNDIAQNGQAYANANGTCGTAMLPLTFNNQILGTGGTGFTAVYSTKAPGPSYTFDIPPYGSGTLGCIPAGLYTLTISKYGNTWPILFNSGCAVQSGTSAVFGKVNPATCSQVTLQLDLQ